MDNSNLNVTFYSKAIENAAKSKESGRPIFEDRDFVRIMVPGDNLNIIDTLVNETHLARFPNQWELYEMKKNNGKVDQISGTPVIELGITEAQAKELEALNIRTVEQMAEISDAQMQRIAMGGYGLRERAREYIGKSHDVAAEIGRQAREIEELKAQLASQNEKTPRRGRKPQEAKAA